jgi:hypothetical protein
VKSEKFLLLHHAMRQPISSFIQERGLQSATASYSRTTRMAIYRVNNVNSPNRLVVSVFLCNFAVEITRKRMEQIAGRYINPYTDYGFKDDRRYAGSIDFHVHCSDY